MARRRGEQQDLKLGGDPWHADGMDTTIAELARDKADDLARFKRREDEARAALEEKHDDYVNRLTGIGDWNQDKTLGGSRYGLDFCVRFISSIEAEDRWRGNFLGAKIVEKIPEEMTREGWDVVFQPSDDDKEVDDKEDGRARRSDAFPGQPGGAMPMMEPIEKPPVAPIPDIDNSGVETQGDLADEMERLHVQDVVLEALQYERAYGGGAILIGADDGIDDLTKPLDEKNIQSINFLTAFQGGREGEVIAWSYYRDPRAPKYGEVEIYMIRNIGVSPYQASTPGGTAPAKEKPITPVFWVHETRLLVFAGKSPSRRARTQMRGWGDSIFMRVDSVLAQDGQTWGGIVNLMSELKLDVLAVDGLPEKIAGDRASKGNPLVKRARTIKQTKSIANMLVIDKEKELATRLMGTVNGVPELLQQGWLRVACAAGLPLSLLTGQVKGGLGDAGNTDVRYFYDDVASTQNRQLTPKITRLSRLMQLAKTGPTKGKLFDKWHVKMRPLYRLSALEEADRRLKVAQADQIYMAEGAVSPAETAGSRFGGSEYNPETMIDIEGRKQAAAKDSADRAARAKQLLEQAKTQPPQVPDPKPPAAPPPKTDEGDFDETKHPRDKDGKFSSGGGAGETGSSSSSGAQATATAPKTQQKTGAELLEHASNTGGFTYNATTGEYATKGYAVSVHQEHERVITHELGPQDIDAYLSDKSQALKESGAHFGMWHDVETGKTYLDVTHVEPDKDKAVALARAHNQEGIYSLHEGKTIITKEEAERRR